MSRVVLRRNRVARAEDVGRYGPHADPNDKHALARGEYIRVPDENPLSSIAHAFTCCPRCGLVATLAKRRPEHGRGHDVAADGAVSPSLVCPFPPCTWHVFVQLEDWGAP